MAGATTPVTSSRQVFWRAFALLGALTLLWSLASPLAAGPDENAHVVKAAAVVRGDLRGTSSPDNIGSGTVTVPALYAALMAYPQCFAFQPSVSAECAGPLPGGDAADDPTEAGTWVIRNNPAYYAVVGLPTLLPPGVYVVYLMRLISGLLCSALLAWAFSTLHALPRRAPLVMGVVAAVTPMVIFLNSVVNSSGLEISASLALWVGLFALLRHPDPDLLPRRAAGIAVVTIVLANARGLSLLYIAVIVLVAVASAPLAHFVTAVTDRRTWPWLAAIVAGIAASLAWTLSASTLAAGGAEHPDLTFLSVAKRTLVETNDYLLTAIGRFGWLDTSLPMMVMMAFVAAVGLVVLLGLALSGRRDAVLLLAVVGIAIAVPVVIHAWQARSVGYIWTARYSMPLYVGVTVTAGFVAHRRFGELPRWLDQRLVAVVATTVGLVQLAAYLVNLRRYVSGESGTWLILLGGDWSPPVLPGLLLLGVLATTIASALALIRWSSPGEPG